MVKKRNTHTNKDKSVLFKLFADGETDTVSSKRVIAVFSFIALIALSFLSAFKLNILYHILVSVGSVYH